MRILRMCGTAVSAVARGTGYGQDARAAAFVLPWVHVQNIRHPRCSAMFLILFCVGILLMLLENPTSLDDGLRHYAYARLLREEGVFAIPGWSRFFYQGALKDVSTDPWFLADVLMVPLTFLPVETALKLFAFLSVALVMSAFLLLLRTVSLSNAERAVFLLVLFAEPQFLGRLLLARPFALVTGLSIILLWALLRRKHVLVGFLLAVGTLLSQLVLIPLLLGILKMPFLAGRQRASLACSIAMGTTAGFVLHPGAWEYVAYLTTSFPRISLFSSEGKEMLPGALQLSMGILALLAPVILLLLIGVRRGTVNLRRDHDVQYLLVTVALLAAGYLLRVRMIDFLWPFMVFLFAFLYERSKIEWHRFVHSLHLPRFVIPFLLVLGTLSFLVAPWIFLRDDAEKSLASYATLSLIPSGVRVFNTDWRVFSPAVLLRPDLRYATGIDHMLTLLADPNVAKLLRALRTEVSPDALERTLRSLLTAYPSDYLVMLHGTSPRAIAAAQKLSELSLVSASGALAIFAISSPDLSAIPIH